MDEDDSQDELINRNTSQYKRTAAWAISGKVYHIFCLFQESVLTHENIKTYSEAPNLMSLIFFYVLFFFSLDDTDDGEEESEEGDSNSGEDDGEEEEDEEANEDDHGIYAVVHLCFQRFRHKNFLEPMNKSFLDAEENEDAKADDGAFGRTAGDLARMSSDEDSDKCPICLNSFISQLVATPENCEHYFCLDCILEWTKVGVSLCIFLSTKILCYV